MPQQPSRRDVFSPPPRVGDLTHVIRHHGQSLRSRDPGYLDGRFASPQPVLPGASEQVGEDGSGDADAGQDSILFINTDQFVIDGPGDQTFLLSYIPIQDGGTSLHVRWVPLHVPVDNWTCDDNALRVTDPGWLAGDMVEVAYAYEYDGEQEPSDEVTGYGSSGWKWLQFPFHDPNDYSDPLFDDSAWDTATAPFGETTPAHDVPGTFDGPSEVGWLDYATLWEQNTQMWARREVDVEAGIAVQLSTRLNRTLKLWWNGNYRGATTAASLTWTIPADLVLASNVVVFKATDDSWAGHHTGCYFDVQINQTIEEAPL